MIEIKEATPDFDVLLSPIHRLPYLDSEDLAVYLGGKDKTLYLLLEEDKVLGFLAVSISFDEADIDYLAIREEEEGKGYATRLIKYFIEENKQLKTVFLEVRESNKRAISLYEGLGFVFYRRRKGYYSCLLKDVFMTEDALCYRKELVP